MIKTFRGLLEDGGQDHIRLQTIKGKVGYRIVKFQIIVNDPVGGNSESVVKIFTTEQTTITRKIDFTNTNLLACAVWAGNTAGHLLPSWTSIIFDQEVFNQDIFITHQDDQDVQSCNYYLELEVIPLTDHDAEFTTLKDIRGRNTTP